MNRLERLYSDMSRLGRETEMLDAVVIMLSEDNLQRPAANDQTQRDVIVKLINRGYALADAVNEQTGHAPNYERPELSDTRQIIHGYRQAHQQVVAAASLLPQIPEDTLIKYRDLTLRPGEVVPQRIAEVVLAHEDLLSAWSIEEADPDSVLDAIDAMLRRLIQMDTAPALTIETEEGERWDLAGGGPRVFGDRENLALWLSRGEEGDLEFEKPLSAPPVLS